MKKIALILLVILLFYTRFVNLDWGMPYPMHPDERNMTIAIQNMNCDFNFAVSNVNFTECLHPHFFAYGQFPLYLAYGGIQLYHRVIGYSGYPSFLEATIALRTVSALSSILLVFVLLKIIELIYPKKKDKVFTFQLLSLSFFIFQPYAIQFSHFGTTESLLMLFYSLLIYYSLKLLLIFDFQLSTKYIIVMGIFSGLALGTKTSSILFLGVPILVIIVRILRNIFAIGGTKNRIYRDTWKEIVLFFLFICISVVFFILSSPQSLLNWKDFLSSMDYESAVGLGTYLPFYTRQFTGTVPLLFQFQNIIPYVLGWPQFIIGILGFILLPWRAGKQVAELKGPNSAHKPRASRLSWVWSTGGKFSILTESVILNPYNLLRIALLISFLPPSFFFAKWTRFIAPSFPLFSIFAILFLLQLTKNNVKIVMILICIAVIPGISFLSIYLFPDVRFIASEWIYKNIPSNSKILSETANVIDIPISTPHTLNPKPYQISSFNFYDLDTNQELQTGLSYALKQADYIFIPSRRIFKNHSAKNYPILSQYYSDLFSGKSGFEKVAEFSSYPSLSMFGKRIFEFADENAEETWTVFDHPVIRIYKRITNDKANFSNYETIPYTIPPVAYTLLVADTPEKWERGLMYVQNKKDIGGLDGMIFQFQESAVRSFWNKNTLAHLTLYWIDKKKVVGISDLPSIIETGGVISTISSPSEADTVIEIVR